MATKKKTAAKKPAAKKSTAKKSTAKKSSAKAIKYVYTWGAGKADGHGKMKELLGGKGANLAEMCGHLSHSPLTGLHARTRTAQAFPAYTYAPASSLPPSSPSPLLSLCLSPSHLMLRAPCTTAPGG